MGFVTVLVILLIILINSKLKTVTVIIDGEKTKFITYQKTVGNLLTKENIKLDSKDKIYRNLQDKVINNDIIIIDKAININVNVDNKTLNIKSAEKTVDAMLKAENIVLKQEDKMSTFTDTKLVKDMNIVITRVETKTINESVPIDFKTVIQNDDNMLASKSKVLKAGQKGEKQITTNIRYENGKEVSRNIVKETVVKSPVDNLTVKGSLAVIPVSRGGSPSDNYSKVVKVKTTAYWAVYGIGTTSTSSGRKAVRNPDGYSTVAVDPNVFPMGTKLYIEGYGYAIAADQGTAIRGNWIDVYFNTYKEACNWGLKYVNVYVHK